MNIEPDFQAELKAHYSAVRARLWTPRSATLNALLCLPPQEPRPEPEPAPVLMQPIMPPTPEQIAATWREVDERLFGRVSPKAVICVAASYFQFNPLELTTSKSRMRRFVRARDAVMYIMRKFCRNSFGPISVNQISHIMGIDHSSAFTAIKRVPKWMKLDENFAQSIGEIMELLKRSEK